MSRTPSPPLTRKKPQCHACGMPMAGHKRYNGLPLCSVKEESPTPPSSLASPPPSTRGPSYSSLFSGSLSSIDSGSQASLASLPATPSRDRTPKAIHAPTFVTPSSQRSHELSFELTEAGMWRRRNPNWIDPPALIPRPPTPAGSFVSTVLVDDDGNTVRGSDQGHDDVEDDAVSVSESFIGNVATNLKGRHVVSMFATKRTNLARTQQLAAKQGVHATLVRLPNGKSTKRGLQKSGSWWMVLGRDPAAVGRVVTESQSRMPGVMEDSMAMYEGPRLTTFLQLILAGLIGGIVTIFGVSYL